MRAKFREEPTEDFFAETLNNGIADGTLRLSDSDYAESFDLDADDDGKQLVIPFTSHQTHLRLDSVLGPVTSTPHPRKQDARPAKAREEFTVKVQVHDGYGNAYHEHVQC